MPSPRLLVSVVLLSALGGTSTALAQAAPSRVDRCGTPQVRVAPSPPVGWYAGPGPQRVVYLNRNGGTYDIRGSQTNASTNVVTTSVTANRSPRTATIAPLGAGFDWPKVAACVVASYATYDIRFVENEPPAGTTFIEAVVGGTGTELGFGANQLYGIAAADNFCGVTETGVAFSFSETHRGVPKQDEELCATIAHEVGHLLALEHEVLAADMMSYVAVNQSPMKSFVNMDVRCGTAPGSEIGCSCSSNTTNSAMRLGMYVGARPTERTKPTLRINSPSGDGRVAPMFTVDATAGDDAEMGDVVVFVDGLEVGHDGTPAGDRYEVAVSGVTLGNHMLGVVARDRAGNTTRVDLPIIVALLGNGADCQSGAQCTGGICATNNDGNFCTQSCDPANNTCGADFTCSPVAGGNLCVPESGGCCQASTDPRGSLLLILGVGLILVGRRRRRAA